MTQEELMIGDWVQDIYDKMPVQIDTHWTLYNVEFFEPIPITPEILKKNGFESVEFQFCVPEYCYSEIIDDKYTTVDVTVKENYTNPDFNWSLEIHNPKVFSGRGFINNIHEFQHALKLCGIEKEIKL